MQQVNTKGFLGPIGDDLPSLIPLLFALVIFFSTFTFAFQVFERGNDVFDLSVKIVKISQALKGDSYVGSAEEFFDACDEINIRGLNFRAALLDYDFASQKMDGKFNVLKIINDRPEDVGVFQADDEFLACEQTDGEEINRNSRLQVRIFSVAFQDDGNKCLPGEEPEEDACTASGFVIRPLTLVIAVWR